MLFDALARPKTGKLHSLSLHLLLAGLLIAIGMLVVSCNELVYPTPVFRDAPESITLNQLLADYEKDPEAAENTYSGQTFFIPGVVIDEVVSDFTDHYAFQMGGELYCSSGPVRFKPAYLYDLDPIGPEFVVDIMGDISGWLNGTFYIIDCTFNIVKGGDLPPASEY